MAFRIVRSASDRNFSRIPNAAIRDRDLSWKARGILTYLLGLDDGWCVDADMLAGAGPDGRHAILAGLKELDDAGYVQRAKRRGESGQWVTDFVVYDMPQKQTDETAPTSGFPTSDNPTPGDVNAQVAPEAGFPTSGPPTSGQPTSGQPTVGKPDAKPTEDLEEDLQEEQEPGGTLPPDPLRPQDPPSSGPGTDPQRSTSMGGDQPVEAVGDHRPRAHADTPAPAQHATPTGHSQARIRGQPGVPPATADPARTPRAGPPPGPQPDDRVWVRQLKPGIAAHRDAPNRLTGCGYSTRTYHRPPLTAADAVQKLGVTWCSRPGCWPPEEEST